MAGSGAKMETDFYDLLEVPRDADDATLKAAYRRLVKQFHPDVNPGDANAEQRFKAIGEAYEVLKDPQKRAAYDRYGKAAFQNGHAGPQDFSGFSDIFETIFGDVMGRGRGRNVNRGGDLRYDLELSLEEAYTGKDATLSLDVTVTCEPCGGAGAKPGTSARACTTCGGQGKVGMRQGFFMVERTCPACQGAGRVIADPCDSCHGTGRVEREKTISVKVPAGVDEGTRIRVAGEGEAGLRGGPAGDLYIFVHMKPHTLFQREGTTLFAQAPVSITTVALGGEIEVPGLDRKPATVTVPAGTQTGKQFRVRGRGMPALNGAGFGDLIIQVDVETPVKLTKRQRELLEEFRALEAEEGGKNCPAQTSFFGRLRDAWNELTD